MFLYIRLILAHFIGDFPLQFDKLYALKFKHVNGVFLHTLIIYGCLLLFSWPYLGEPAIWIFLTLIAATHFVQDWAKIRFTRKSKHNFFFFVLDQILHVSLLAILFFTDLKNGQPPLNNNGNIFITLYNSNFICLYLTVALISSYMGYYIIALFKKDFLKIEQPIVGFEKGYGFFERFVITSALLAEHLSPLLILFTLAFRPILLRTMKKKLNLSNEFSSWTEIILSGAYSILIGLIFQLAM
ncbi:MAG: DUF3307 domain-containing protein [Candidatus Omnitrophica bacterium]|nr:DUF3307 domain-containing protein [Candidatus Omnitrophota bacterium]